MPDREWLEYRRDERRRATEALSAAADKLNACRDIEERLHRQGRDHRIDGGWLMAVSEFRQLSQQAAGHGFDGQAISEEAGRRRN